MQLEKIREAAERVARSEGLEVFDIEWKIGKQRILRVSIWIAFRVRITRKALVSPITIAST